MRLLITGGSGFVGSTLIDRIQPDAEKIVVIDNFATGRRDNLAEYNNLEIVEGSISDTALVDAAFDQCRPDVVVHAAASYKDPDAWVEDSLTNVLGSVNIARASQRL